MANLCGVDQKIMVEVLESIKKDPNKGRGASTSSISPPQTPQVTVEDDEEEEKGDGKV